MSDAKRTVDDYFLVQSGEYGEVFFPPQAPFIRGYLVPSKPMQRIIVRCMERFDYINILLLLAAIGIGWLSGRIGYALSLWLGACEVTYWVGLRRLTRRLVKLPLRQSLQIYTHRFKIDELLCGVIVSGVLGGAAIMYGSLNHDHGMLILGCGLLIWSARLISIFCYRLLKSFMKFIPSKATIAANGEGIKQ